MAPIMQPPPEVADFLSHLKENRVTAYGSPSLSPAASRPFIPTSVLSAYLTRLKIKELLRCFYRSEVEWEAIQHDFLAVFSILITINRGEYITHFVQSHNLTDDRLPFKHIDSFPSQCAEFWEAFYTAQWEFCAETFKRGKLNGTRFPSQIILPIVSRTNLKDGIDSCTEKIEIEPSLNSLFDNGKQDSPPTNTFVLKTCRIENAHYHHREVEAYRALMHQSEDVSDHIVKFHGSWEQDGIYNLLLEYVEGGTLDSYFGVVEPPRSKEENLKFWGNLLNPIKILERMHKLPALTPDSPFPSSPSPNMRQLFFQMIHHDIKPQNILVSSKTGPSRFDVTFKLADLGLITLEAKTPQSDGEPIAVRDRQGTQMYSAPEYCRDDSFLRTSNMQAETGKDIWALGCVWSEAAVWCAWGQPGLLRYWKRRTAEIKPIPTLQASAYSSCFHNGEKVLGTVFDIHGEVRKYLGDFFISDIINLIEEMLEEAQSRLDATQVYRRIRNALRTATRSNTEASSRENEDHLYPAVFCSSPNPEPVRLQPAELPPKLHSRGGFGLGINQSPHSVQSCSQTNHYGSTISSPSTDEGRYHSASSSIGFHSLQCARPLNESGASIRYSSQAEPPPESGHTRQAYQGTQDGRDSTTHFRAPFPQPGLTNGVHAPLSFAKEVETEERSPSAMRQSPNLAPTLEVNGVTMPPPKFVRVSIDDVLEWRKSVKNSRKLKTSRLPISQLEGCENLGRLCGRDQIYLVDNSKSMKPHWENVKKVVQGTGYLVKNFDRDNMDMYLTNSSKEVHSGNSSKLVATLKNVTPAGQCDMRYELGKVLDRVAKALDEYSGEKTSSNAWGRVTNKKKKEGTTIYILTDGVWQSGPPPLCGVEEPIRKIVKKLQQYNMTSYRVGIQFISFGNDPVASTRFRLLDSGLTANKDFDIDYDIVDVEPWNRNVWKMLFGSLDPWWDDDNENACETGDPEKSQGVRSSVLRTVPTPG